ncbi:cob(I)yrinic acid a,c-diamide adenosyltransferase [Candidatus Marinimicrobia bacterium]|jgi:cob(I)alamin adenosyltransferase|nr:cob(I)yrinic acid a,c-diamide adenosyltransferase [Candidatus Neomarinimicrobiota bacterium]
MRITKVTTKTGDSGQTGLGNGERISKNSLRIHAMGSIDKLNSVIGWARIEVSEELSKSLERIQQDLFNLGGELAVPDVEMNLLSDERLRWLESHIENINDELPPLTEFILPGGSEDCARIHVARAECRDSERILVALGEIEAIPPLHKMYLNRLSDYFFIVARKLKLDQGKDEISWSYKK